MLFFVSNGQEPEIEAGGCLGRVFVIFLYIRTFTNVLLHFFLIGNSQEFWIEMGHVQEKPKPKFAYKKTVPKRKRIKER
jgi:hypothetical protein